MYANFDSWESANGQTSFIHLKFFAKCQLIIKWNQQTTKKKKKNNTIFFHLIIKSRHVPCIHGIFMCPNSGVSCGCCSSFIFIFFSWPCLPLYTIVLTHFLRKWWTTDSIMISCWAHLLYPKDCKVFWS